MIQNARKRTQISRTKMIVTETTLDTKKKTRIMLVLGLSNALPKMFVPVECDQ